MNDKELIYFIKLLTHQTGYRTHYLRMLEDVKLVLLHHKKVYIPKK